jgi:hypothetical protein
VGRTLLSDAVDLGVALALAVDSGVGLPVWVGHSCPTLLLLGLSLPLLLSCKCGTGTLVRRFRSQATDKRILPHGRLASAYRA